MNILEVRKILIEGGWIRSKSVKAKVGDHECEFETWTENVRMILIQIFNDDSKSFHVFRIAFTSLGHDSSPFKDDTLEMLKMAME